MPHRTIVLARTVLLLASVFACLLASLLVAASSPEIAFRSLSDAKFVHKGRVYSFGDTIVGDASGAFVSLGDGTYFVMSGDSFDDGSSDEFAIIWIYLRQSPHTDPREVTGYVVEGNAHDPCYRTARVKGGSFLLTEDDGSYSGNGTLDVLWQYCEGIAEPRGEVRKGQVTMKEVPMERGSPIFGQLAKVAPTSRG